MLNVEVLVHKNGMTIYEFSPDQFPSLPYGVICDQRLIHGKKNQDLISFSDIKLVRNDFALLPFSGKKLSFDKVPKETPFSMMELYIKPILAFVDLVMSFHRTTVPDHQKIQLTWLIHYQCITSLNSFVEE